ncbi:MAG TPA: hypothetical protein VIT68_00775 [Candidatus Gracilibacteria bacterium]
MDLQTTQTKTGKTAQDFTIPPAMLQKHPDIVDLLIKSESMDDDERQYWFNLYESMEDDHIERLRGILAKEQERRAQIEQKYGPQKQKFTPEEIAARNEVYSQRQESKWAEIKAEEIKYQESDEEASEDILGELDNL